MRITSRRVPDRFPGQMLLTHDDKIALYKYVEQIVYGDEHSGSDPQARPIMNLKPSTFTAQCLDCMFYANSYFTGKTEANNHRYDFPTHRVATVNRIASAGPGYKGERFTLIKLHHDSVLRQIPDKQGILPRWASSDSRFMLQIDEKRAQIRAYRDERAMALEIAMEELATLDSASGAIEASESSILADLDSSSSTERPFDGSVLGSANMLNDAMVARKEAELLAELERIRGIKRDVPLEPPAPNVWEGDNPWTLRTSDQYQRLSQNHKDMLLANPEMHCCTPEGNRCQGGWIDDCNESEIVIELCSCPCHARRRGGPLDVAIRKDQQMCIDCMILACKECAHFYDAGDIQIRCLCRCHNASGEFEGII